MANELKHGSVGTELTQTEWEAVGAHVFASQAAGDIMYASSTSQLSRLAKGADNTVLHLASGIPAWSATLAGLTLTTPTISSTGFANANHAHAASNSGGTVAASALSGSSLASGVVTTSVTTVGVLNAGSINTGFGNIDNGSSTLDTGAATVASLDCSNGSLSNVGASGNNWTSAQIIHRGTGNIIMSRETSGTSGEQRVFDLVHNSTGNVADGSGPAFTFRQNDTDGSEQELGRISFIRAGADNTGDFRVSPTITGGSNLGLKLTSVGVLSVDLSGSGSAAQVDLFDQYDDAAELQRFAYSGEGIEDVVPEVTEEQRLANRERMVDMGILEPVPGASSGYHMRIQPLTRLLAGGIYQNRHRMDSQYDELSRRLEAIGA